MPDSDLSHDDVQRILALVDSTPHFAEFHLKFGDIEIELRKPGAAPAEAPRAPVAAPPAQPPAQPSATAATQPAAPPPAAAPAVAPAAAAPAADAPLPPGMVAVKAPMVGTCYRAPEPGAKPFVEVGQRVTRDSVVCIIEVMKLMNSIAAGCDGVVTQVLAGDSEPVEYGQVLVVIDPQA